ncbi:MAG: hypothetical protein AAF602_22030 [Myxococcota bacterium]
MESLNYGDLEDTLFHFADTLGEDPDLGGCREATCAVLWELHDDLQMEDIFEVVLRYGNEELMFVVQDPATDEFVYFGLQMDLEEPAAEELFAVLDEMRDVRTIDALPWD